jgi:signal transduction histidine kinase
MRAQSSLLSRSLNAPRRLRMLAAARLIGVAVAAALLFLGRRFIGPGALAPLVAIIGLLALADLALLVSLSADRGAAYWESRQIFLLHGQIILDLIGIALLLHFAGGAENPFFPFLIFPVIIAAALFARGVAFGYAAAASLLYVGLLGAEAAGWLPHHALVGYQDPAMYRRAAVVLGQGLSLAAICFVTAGALAVLVAALHRRAEQLAESNRQTEERAAHMRALNEQLATAKEDAEHQRSHLDAAYAELQRAYDRLQIRSGHMSELNEQLRAANAECKLRREELEALSQKLKDALQRIETRTEHMSELNEQLRAANAECKARREELERLNAELATANAKLRELEDVRAQFTLLVTHELRAPVAAIQSYLKLILDGYVPQAKTRETLEKAERRAMEQLALISDLLELGRIGSADARGLVQPVQVENLLREQVDVHAASARERKITVNVSIAPDLPPVLANPDQIKSLWTNLISNAIKYNRDGGRVEVSLRVEGKRLVAAVSDTGIGIPPEAMARLFSEFFRADNAKAVSRLGTGLGLSIVKEIVERAGGQITVESELDKGTTFRFWLPAAASAAAPQPAAALPAQNF